MISKLQLTIAKLELKQLEVIDKLSKKNNNEYVIRCITCPDTNKFISVNGDWGKVIGFNESECIGKSIFEFIAPYELDRAKLEAIKMKHGEQFDSFICDMIGKNGLPVSVDWRAKYFPNINAIVSIGRVKR